MTYSLVLKQQKCLKMWKTLLAHGINLLPLIWLWRYWNFSTIPSADCGILMLHMDKQGLHHMYFQWLCSFYTWFKFILYLFSISLLSAYFFLFHKFESIFMELIDFYSLSSNRYHTDVNHFLWLMGTQKKVHLLCLSTFIDPLWRYFTTRLTILTVWYCAQYSYDSCDPIYMVLLPYYSQVPNRR